MRSRADVQASLTVTSGFLIAAQGGLLDRGINGPMEVLFVSRMRKWWVIHVANELKMIREGKEPRR